MAEEGEAKAKFLKESVKLYWNFQRGGGGGCKPKTFCGRGMDLFKNHTL